MEYLIYRQKYIKYKQKYLELCSQKGGNKIKIYVIGSCGGTISTSILNKLNTPEHKKNYDVIYTYRERECEYDFKNIKCDLHDNGSLVKLIDEIDKNKTKFYVINCAADKDSNAVKKWYETTLNKKDPETIDLTKSEFHHWTMNVATKFADLLERNKYMYLIHLSTVYVNKGEFLENQYSWSNNFINYKESSDSFKLNSDKYFNKETK